MMVRGGPDGSLGAAVREGRQEEREAGPGQADLAAAQWRGAVSGTVWEEVRKDTCTSQLGCCTPLSLPASHPPSDFRLRDLVPALWDLGAAPSSPSIHR